MLATRFGGGLFRKTFWSYTAILIIPILIFSASNTVKTVAEAQNVMRQRHEEDARKIAEGADNKLKELKRLGEVFGDEAWVKKLMLDANVYDAEFDLLKLLDIRKDLQNAAAGSGILSFGAVYYPSKEKVVSPWGVYDAGYFFSSVAALDRGTRRSLDGAAANYQIFKLLPQTSIRLWGEERNVVPVLQSLEVVNNPRAVLLLFIDSSYMTSFIRQYVGGSGPSAVSVTEGGAPVVSYDSALPGASGKADTFTLPSQVSEWAYVVSYPNERLIVLSGMYASLLAAIASVVVGTLSAYAFARITYRPLGVLLHKLAHAAKVDASAKSDGSLSEIRLIESSIDRLLSENESLRHALDDYKSAARSSMLLRLLRGYFHDERQADRLKELGLRYTDGMHYCTMLLDFQAVCDCSDADRLRAIEVVAFMAAEHATSRHRLDYQLFEVTNAEKALLLSSRQPFDGEETIRTVAEHMTEHIRQASGVRPDIVWGTIERGLLGISKSYYAAAEKLHYKQFAKGQVQDGQEPTPAAVDYYYPTGWEVQLINNLKIGNLDTWVQIVDEVRAENEKRQLSEASVVKLIATLMETTLRVLNELNIDAELYARQFAGKYRERDVEAMWGYVYEVGTLICERIRYANTSTAMELGGELLQYVNRHYTSADMSLKKLAEQFRMSVSNVSKTFKEVTGINFYDYLCRLRMERAKELLRESKGEVSRVARLVGYENAYSFRRAFVRYEGIKPDEYAQLSV
ncbi:helix-turn-helix transcriptional regulator [Paenibacillus flagellatus]|uniref:AraC family transcriptional regulator n=1 Tax=Paenibacillus flagellatus TaxID=2211139 RepID=A0A2V5KMN8_9BACL|nr:helix-turn-helix transcriptional regulator [Paenibacillus flagellatus]PYI56470.1 AraC family transcriptional regulator [Paenibacillus flagellatus]